MPIQRQEVPEEEKEPLQGMFGKKPEEETCPSCVQRQEKPEEEEPIQGKFETIQRLETEEDEKLQMKSVVQRQEISEEEDEPIQGRMIETIQRQKIPEEEPLQKKSENNTGMPDNLKAGVESLSGIDMSNVRVRYNSDKPAQVGALAYTQGTNIHVAPGQEKHLPHEAWHVVQQVQGRVKPTFQMNGVTVNDDMGLEREANALGKKAHTTGQDLVFRQMSSQPRCKGKQELIVHELTHMVQKNRSAMQRMRIAPQIRQQDAYNCGLYSIWMAIESLTGADASLITKIKHFASIYSDSMGGLFNFVQMERIIKSLGYTARMVRFHDVVSFTRNLDNHHNDAILLAYSFDARLGKQFDPDTATSSAHWSLLERYDHTQEYIQMKNPHGNLIWVTIEDICSANLQMDGGRFNWSGFVAEEQGLHLFEQERNKYKNTVEELTSRGRAKIQLSGYFIAIN